MIDFLRKNVLIIYVGLLSIIHTACNYAGGTLGASDGVEFPHSSDKINEGLDSLFSKYSEYQVPEKWHDLDNWSKRGMDYLNGRVLYFRESPEEMYFLTASSDTINGVGKTAIFIRAVSNGDTWINFADLSDTERRRMEDRFDKEVIPKIRNFLK
ncbi:MAG: hypothetical protein V4687_04120 [Bacteroidota bacterium]